MRQLQFKEFELFLGKDFTGLFDWFQLTQLNGVTRAEVCHMQTTTEHYIHTFVDYHPTDTFKELEYKPYMYVNSNMINDLPIYESSIYISQACQKMAQILSDGVEPELIEEFGSSLSLAVMDELHYPDVFMKI